MEGEAGAAQLLARALLVKPGMCVETTAGRDPNREAFGPINPLFLLEYRDIIFLLGKWIFF